jgi:hypothetical protein
VIEVFLGLQVAMLDAMWHGGHAVNNTVTYRLHEVTSPWRDTA